MIDLACSPRFSTQRTAGRQTLGFAAANIAVKLGQPFMPWQRHVADVALEVDPATGRFAYQRIVLTVPRQSGKTTLILAAVLLRALGNFGVGRQRIVYTAQTGAAARQKFVDDWQPMLAGTPFRPLYTVRATNGHEALRFRNGSHVGLVATTAKAGHGGTIDQAFLDEAFAHPDGRLEQALVPAMMTRPQPQLWVVSTAGTEDQSPYLFEQVEQGRNAAAEGLTYGVAYFEWSPSPDADPADPATWWSCMPALGYTVTEDVVRQNFESMKLSEFRRAFLNEWTTATHDPVISIAAWMALAVDADSEPGSVALSFDVTPNSSYSSIGATSALGERDHLDVIEHKPGTDWLPGRLAELVAKYSVSAVVYDPSSPAAAIAARLADSRTKSKLVPVTAREFGEACQMITTGVADQSISHNGHAAVAAALDGAGKRTVGDLWRWSRTSTSVDISPLVAITLALWGHKTHKPKGVQMFDIGAQIEAARAAQDAERTEGEGPPGADWRRIPIGSGA